ncbi:hypothetical protein BDV06DRAFT_196605 [Aspergillus oleicola]
MLHPLVMDEYLSQTLSARCFLPGDYPRARGRVAKEQEHSLPNPTPSSGTKDGAIAKKRGRPRIVSSSDKPRKVSTARNYTLHSVKLDTNAKKCSL